MKNIIYSFLGTTLDSHRRENMRWSFWRPSVALALQDDLHFDEFHIWYQERFQGLFDVIAKDILASSPGTEVIPELLELRDPWDFEEE